MPRRTYGWTRNGLQGRGILRNLWRSFSDDVWRFVSSQVSRRSAEDIMMEVFSIAIDKFPKLLAVDNQRQWLLTVAKNKSIDCLRKRYRHAEQPPGDLRDRRRRQACQRAPGSHAQGAENVALRREPLVLKYERPDHRRSGQGYPQVRSRHEQPSCNRARVALRTALSPVFPTEVNRES